MKNFQLLAALFLALGVNLPVTPSYAQPATLNGTVSITDSVDPAIVGGNVTYTVTVTNPNTAFAFNLLVLQLTIDPALQLVSISPSPSNVTAGSALINIGTLNPLASFVATVVFTVPSNLLPFNVPILTANSPASVARDYHVAGSSFGPNLTPGGITGIVVQASNGSVVPLFNVCTPLLNGAAVAGKIAIADDGGCSQTIKVKNIQNAGGIGAIIRGANNAVSTMTGSDPTIVIPSVYIGQEDGTRLISAISSNLNVTLSAPLNFSVFSATVQSTNQNLLNGALTDIELTRIVADTDRDGIQDQLDKCPLDPAKNPPGKCGCGVPDVDLNNNSIIDCFKGKELKAKIADFNKLLAKFKGNSSSVSEKELNNALSDIQKYIQSNVTGIQVNKPGTDLGALARVANRKLKKFLATGDLRARAAALKALKAIDGSV